MPVYQDLDDLNDVAEQDTIVTTTLGNLRSALGYDRLGKYVLGQIVEELEGHNLGYFPRDLLEDNPEPRQWQEVRVYKRNSDAGRIIRAVTHPSPSGDQTLKAVVGSDAQSVLDRVRALVCE